jgi:hypothetical protein
LPGVLAYGTTQAQAGEKAKALAFRVLAERIETDSSLPYISQASFFSHYEPVAVN